MTARVTVQPSGTPPIIEIGAGDDESAGWEEFVRHALACFSEGMCPWCGSRLTPTTESNSYGPKMACGPCGSVLSLGRWQGVEAVAAYVPPMRPGVPKPVIIRRTVW